MRVWVVSKGPRVTAPPAYRKAAEKPRSLFARGLTHREARRAAFSFSRFLDFCHDAIEFFN
jgi:hypothetical protein